MAKDTSELPKKSSLPYSNKSFTRKTVNAPLADVKKQRLFYAQQVNKKPLAQRIIFGLP